jgi:hypothetical protein
MQHALHIKESSVEIWMGSKGGLLKAFISLLKTLNFSHFVAHKIWQVRGISPRCGRAHRLPRREPGRCLLVPMDATFNLLQTARN